MRRSRFHFFLIAGLAAPAVPAELPDISGMEGGPYSETPFFRLSSSKPVSYLWWYDRVASATRPSSCRHIPSCSRFGAQAVQTHGWCYGSILAVDRLIRENDDVKLSLRVRSGSRLVIPDPIEHNTFWWRSNHESHKNPFYRHLVHAGWTGRLR